MCLLGSSIDSHTMNKTATPPWNGVALSLLVNGAAVNRVRRLTLWPVITIWVFALTKDGGAHTHHGGAFFDGDFHVFGHAHRKLIGVTALDAFIQNAFAHLAQEPEIFPRDFGRGAQSTDRHESDHAHGIVACCCTR